MEALGVSTSKVAELQHESVVKAGSDTSELGATLGVGVVITLDPGLLPCHPSTRSLRHFMLKIKVVLYRLS